MPALAKLTRPKTHRVLLRERLFAALDDARARPLVWVSGPPGAGKSTLVASYVGERKCRAAWYHVDPGDDDVGTFFFYLSQSVTPARRNGRLPEFTPEDRPTLSAFSRRFFRELFQHAPLLVLDNYHELTADSAVHEALENAVEEVPEGGNIIAVSRSGPPRRFARHQLGERMASLDGTALAMSLEETRDVAALRHKLDPRAAQRIHEQSGGWAAGVALALQRAEQLRGAGAETPSEHAVLEEYFEFFARQLLESSAPALQEFLQVTSLLPSMTAAMAERLTGRTDSEAVLEDLYRRGLFTERRATHPPTYQYHDLFRAFLTRRYESQASADALAMHRRAAGALLEQGGQSHHAIQLYLHASDWGAARRAVLASAPILVRQGRGGSIREWIAAMPHELVQRDAWLTFWSGMAHLRVEPPIAREALFAAYRLFEEAGDKTGQTIACSAVIRSYTYEFADVRPLDPWVERLLQLLATEPQFPHPAVELQVITALLLALGFRRPQREPLERCMERLLALLAMDLPHEETGTACGVLLMHLFNVGDITVGDRIAARLEKLIAAGQMTPIGQALGAIQLGRHHMLKREHAAAEARCQFVLELIERHGIALPIVRVAAHLNLSVCALDQDDLELSEARRRHAEAGWLPHRRFDEFALTRQRVWLACRRAEWETALSLAEKQIVCAQDCGVFWFLFEAYVQKALLCAELDREAEFRTNLAGVRPLIEGTGYEHFGYMVDLAEAYWLLLKEDYAGCHAKLRTGLPASKRDEAKLILRMHPPILPRLFAQALVAGIEADEVRNAIRTLHLRPPSRDSVGWPWPFRIHTLGRFEVLRDGRPLEYSRKAPRKTLALLKAIIALGGDGVREQRLLDTFWPDEEGDAAARSLGAALHRLRTLLGDADAVVQHGGVLSLDTSRVWVDAWAFEALLARPGAVDPGELLALYRGSFLAEDESEPWSVTMRERLRGRFIHAVSEAGKRLEAEQRPDAALECYLRGLDADPIIEQFYQGLIRCYIALERPSEALSAYQRLKRLLSMTLNVKPSAQTERLLDLLRPSKTI